MQQLIVQREVLIDAPLAHVWQLVATEEGLRQWWGNTIFLEAKEGGRCEEWRNEVRPGELPRPTRWQGVVSTYAPPYQLMLTMRVQEAQQEMPELTTIAISLEARSNGEQTRVYVTQRAFGPTSAIGTGQREESIVQPQIPQSLPLAQLQRPAPGTYRGPQPAQLATIGTTVPSYTVPNQQLIDELALTWQRRLTSLLEGISYA